MDRADIKIFDTPEELYKFAAKYILGILSKISERSGRFTLALSGGSTPGKVYETMAEIALRHNIDWSATHLFWGDERCVSPDNELSNYRMVKESLIAKVDIPEENIHRIKGELQPQEGAEIYEREIKESFRGDDIPRFDLILLGLGEDAHTASLFPFSHALNEEKKWAVPVKSNDGTDRITLTYPIINNAGRIIFIVTGGHKAEALSNVHSSDQDYEKYPACGVKPYSGETLWLLDKPAALYLELK